jgi:enterochelin esterase-like enzyme/dienelactone hydrolase
MAGIAPFSVATIVALGLLPVLFCVKALIQPTRSHEAATSVLLAPSGNYPVGRTLLHWTDLKRTDPVAAAPATKREFVVVVWYPAERNTSMPPALWMPELWASSEAQLLYSQRVDSPNPLTMRQAQQAIRETVSNSIAEAPMAQTLRRWPVLLFAPGAGVNTAFYSTFTEDLASHGYVVFGIVPAGWVATVFPGGRKVPASDKRSDDFGWITATALPLWADDLRFMLDRIEEVDRDYPNSLFFHRLDLTRIGAFGHSFGGAASILAGLQDQRIRAVLNLDGSPFSVLSKTALPKPFMVIKHSVSTKYAPVPLDDAGKAMQAQVEEELSSVYLKGAPGYRVEIDEAQHMTFCDMAVLPAWAEVGRRLGVEDATDGEGTLALIRDYAREFFDKFLLGNASPLLDRPQGRYGILILSFTSSSADLAVTQAASLSASNGWPIRAVDTGPRIEALKQRLESGDHRALEEFWQETTRRGTPLIESVNGTLHDVVVTFVRRGDQNTRNVTLLAPIAHAPGLRELPLTRLLDTDLWHGSWEMKDDFRFTYRFVVNLKPGQDARRLATLDPLNTHTIEVSFEGNQIPAEQFSIAAMPHAPDDRWIVRQPGVPAGKVESYASKSAILGTDRKIWVYTPPDYSAKAPPYQLLLLLDGFNYQHWIPAPVILDNLIHAQKFPPTVAVLIDNPPGSRVSDLQYNPAFVNFLADELLPWLHAHFDVTHEPQMTVIGGYSMGGAAAAFAALRRPDLFGNVLSQSGSFWEGHEDNKWEFLAAQYQASPKLPVRFVIEAGLLEDVSNGEPTLLAANRHLVKILKRKGYRVTYEEVGGTHEPVHWRGTLPGVLMALTK